VKPYKSVILAKICGFSTLKRGYHVTKTRKKLYLCEYRAFEMKKIHK